MHEYSVAHGLLEALLAHLHAHPVGGHVRVVHVRKGELVILSAEALGEAWKILSEGTALAGSQLELETVSTKVRCAACEYEGPAGRLCPDEAWHAQFPLLSCPRCGARVEVVEGKELVAVSLSVDDAREGGPALPTDDGPKATPAPGADTPAGPAR